MLNWEQPMDTGRGGRAEGIVQYLIESSTCPTFSTQNAECLYQQQAHPGEGKVFLNFNLTRAVLKRPREAYFIRISAENSVGRGQISEILEQRFMIIPRLLSPLVSEKQPLRIAAEDDYVHIWKDGSLLRSNQISITISGLDLMVSTDLKNSIDFLDQSLDPVVTSKKKDSI